MNTREKLILVTGLTLTSCAPSGMAVTRNEAIYIGGAQNIPWIVDHEHEHQKEMERIGEGKFWFKYVTDPVWRCEEEKRTGIEPHLHWACARVVLEDE